MAEEGNGHGSPTRLDRIERAIETLARSHQQLGQLHTQVQTAQNLMNATISLRRMKVLRNQDQQLQTLRESQRRINATLASIKKLLERSGR